MKEINDIKDDQIRVIGKEEEGTRLKQRVLRIAVLMAVGAGLLAAGFILLGTWRGREAQETEPTYFDPLVKSKPVRNEWMGREVSPQAKGFVEIRDTLVNDIPLKIHIPHNAEMSLHVGRMDRQDSSVIYAAQAADVRADNGGIVGAFVLKGVPLSHGRSKKGYCASIDGEVTIGMAENTSLFEKATEKDGYFFRQYPLVSNGKLVENEPKGKSIRRAICSCSGEIFMVQTETRESFHDFAQALVDLGVLQAVNLVGSSTYGWAVDEAGKLHEFGNSGYYAGNRQLPKNISYLVWKRKK